MEERLARPRAAAARLGPRLTAAAAVGTRAADRHDERRYEAGEGLAWRQREIHVEHVARVRLARKRAAQRVTYLLDDAAGRRKINRDFVGKAFVRHARTIGARSRDVKIASGRDQP